MYNGRFYGLRGDMEIHVKRGEAETAPTAYIGEQEGIFKG